MLNCMLSSLNSSTTKGRRISEQLGNAFYGGSLLEAHRAEAVAHVMQPKALHADLVRYAGELSKSPDSANGPWHPSGFRSSVWSHGEVLDRELAVQQHPVGIFGERLAPNLANNVASDLQLPLPVARALGFF